MSSSDKIVYAPRDESGHANSRKVRSTSPKVIATESYLARWQPSAYGLGPSFSRSITFSRSKNPRPTAWGSHSRARQLTTTFGLVRRTWRSLRIPSLSSLYAKATIYNACTISAVFHAYKAGLMLFTFHWSGGKSYWRHTFIPGGGKKMTSALLLLPAGVKVTSIFTFTRGTIIDGEQKFTHKFAFA